MTDWTWGPIHDTAGDAELRRRLNVKLATLGTTLKSTQSSLGWFNVKDYGATGNGVTDDTVAIQAALTAAGAVASGVVYFPSGIYRVTVPLVVSGYTTLLGTGANGSIILKSHTGDGFQVHGDYINFIEMDIHGNTAVDTTYGTSGVAVNFDQASSGYACSWMGGMIFACDFIFKFTTDAGHAFRCTGAFLQQYTTAPGSEPNSIWVVGDTTAAFRQFANCIYFSKFYLRGALDTLITGCAIRSIDSDAATSILTVQGCVMANNNNPQTWFGSNISVVGCRISGSVTLGASSSGCWVANIFTFGTLTNSSGNELWDILHRYEDSNHRYTFGPHQLRIGYAGMLASNRTTYWGDVATTLFNTDTPTNVWNTPLTTNRTVTLTTGASMYNGERFRIVRAAAATGPYNLVLGATGKNLAAGQWAEVEYDGSNWNIVASGDIFGPSWFNVKDHGARGDGATDDAAALRAAITACGAAGGGTVYFPAGTYLLGSDPLPASGMYGVCIRGAGMAATVLKKGFNGTWFTVATNSGNFVEWRDLQFDGQYGTYTGKGFAYGGVGTDYHRFDRVRFYGIESTHIELSVADAGGNMTMVDCEGYPGPGQGEYQSFRTVGIDTGARFRRWDNCLFNLGYLTLTGAVDSFISNCAFKRIETDANCQEFFVSNCLWGNLGAAMTLYGPGHAVVACRFAGNVTLDASYVGQFVGNFQTSGTFTDNTTANNAIVIHHPLSAGYNTLGKLKWSGTVNPEEVQSFRVSTNAGDADFTLTLDQGPKIIRYNTALTANRTVTLPTGRDGVVVRVIRQASCTGAFTVTVGGVATLSAAGQWCDVAWDGPSAAWILAASSPMTPLLTATTDPGIKLAGNFMATGTNHSFGTSTAYTDRNLEITGNPTGATSQYGVVQDMRGDSGATANIIGIYSKVGTVVAAYTASNVESIRAVNPVLGAGSTITTAVGYAGEDINTGTTNYAMKLGRGIVQINDLLRWATDNTYDVGAAGATRPRDLYLGRDFYGNAKFGCNAATPQAAATVHAAVGAGAATNVVPYGFATAAEMDDMKTLVNQLRAALVANGICV